MGFSERLKRAAQHAKVEWSQTAVGQSLGLRKQTVDRWFGNGEPKPAQIYLIADKWSIDPRWLATGEGDMLPRLSTQQPPAAYDAKIKAGAPVDAEKLLVLLRTFLDTDDEGRFVMLKLASEVRAHAATSAKTRRAKRR